MHFTTVSSILLAGSALAAPSISKRQDTSIDINAVIPAVVAVNTRANDVDIISKLRTAGTQADRFHILDQPGDHVFDFNSDAAGGEATGKGGHSISATSSTFPALIGNGAGMTLGFLGPCGMNTAHVHPRATELNVVVKGRLVTNFIQENGVDAIANTMSLYQMAVFPKGAIHTEFNPDCEDTVFVAGFDSEDPGVNTVAQNFFGLRGDIVGSTLGGYQTIRGADIESFRDQIPANVALGIDSCLNKCGITRNAKRSYEELFN